MDYEKAYKQALERARKIRDEILNNEIIGFPGQITDIFPELRESESEDERIRKVIYKLMLGMREEIFTSQDEIVTKEKALAYLEKKPGIKIWPHPIKDAYLEQKEQKPLSTEDMPYVTDEHFFEREQADSFKYRLAEYMTKNCKKEESPYGYTYKINSETILEMAKEELIKRGELQKPVDLFEMMVHKEPYVAPVPTPMVADEQKPIQSAEEKEFIRTIKSIIADFIRDKKPEDVGFYQQIYDWLDDRHIEPKPVEWSKEDEKIKERLITRLNWITYNTRTDGTSPNITFFDEIAWLKSLRPQWKPTEEQMEALTYAIQILDDGLSPKAARAGEELESLREQLKKL